MGFWVRRSELDCLSSSLPSSGAYRAKNFHTISQDKELHLSPDNSGHERAMVPWLSHCCIPLSSPWWCTPGPHTCTFFSELCWHTPPPVNEYSHLSEQMKLTHWQCGLLPKVCTLTLKRCVNMALYEQILQGRSLCLRGFPLFPWFHVMLVNPHRHPCKGRLTMLCQPGWDLGMWKYKRVGAVSHSLLPNDSARRATARWVGVQFLHYAIWGDDMAVLRSTFKCLSFHFNIKGGRQQ